MGRGIKIEVPVFYDYYRIKNSQFSARYYCLILSVVGQRPSYSNDNVPNKCIFSLLSHLTVRTT